MRPSLAIIRYFATEAKGTHNAWTTVIAPLIAAVIMFILIITIPFGIAALRIGVFALWPFGRAVIKRADAGAGSAIGNVIWFILCG